jgi:Zn-dependent protease/predicted transcriptional regulator
MRWSFKLGVYAGILVQVHWTFLLLLAWVLFTSVASGAGLAAALGSLGFVLAAFACVVLHEFGHALTARRFGIATRDITLLPIGGVARLDRMPEDPRQELLIAVAGPAVNVVIAAALLALQVAAFGRAGLSADLSKPGEFLDNLLALNVTLVLFNLVPAFPMDGGRVLRAILAWATGDFARATQIAATLGQLLAILMGVAGLFQGAPLLMLVALFVYLAAQDEARGAQIRSVFRGLSVRDAMLTDFRALAPEDPLRAAVTALLAGSQQDFPVVAHGAVVGMLTRQDLIRALASQGQDGVVGHWMRRDCNSAQEHETLDAAFARMQACDCPILPVVRGGALVGVLTLENVGELMLIHTALQGRAHVGRVFGRPAE